MGLGVWGLASPIPLFVSPKNYEIMNLKLIALYDASDDFWEQLADEYQNFDFDSFVSRVKILHPEIVRDEQAEEIEGEIQNENEHYILTWEDGMDECVRIYEK